MKHIVRTSGVAALLATVAIGAAACGDPDTPSTGTPTATQATTATQTTGTGTTSTAPATSAKVELGSPEEMAITAPATVKAGSVTFDVTNAGAAPHEFVILKTSTKADSLPTDGGKAQETGLVDRTAELDPGASDTLTVDLAPGHYVVLCNLPGHYQAGMRQDLTVT